MVVVVVVVVVVRMVVVVMIIMMIIMMMMKMMGVVVVMMVVAVVMMLMMMRKMKGMVLKGQEMTGLTYSWSRVVPDREDHRLGAALPAVPGPAGGPGRHDAHPVRQGL